MLFRARRLWVNGGFLVVVVVFFASEVHKSPSTALTAAEGKVRTGSPEERVMAELIKRYRNITFDELQAGAEPKRTYVDELSFDPTAAKHFDRIRTKLKLTDEELELFRKNGFVSVDHSQRHAFGSAYYQIYSADLPVLITTDSVLNALHNSFDELLQDLETYVISPALADVLSACHESLAKNQPPTGLANNYADLDLYLTVSRNLLAASTQPPRIRKPAPLLVPSKLGNDDAVAAILELIDNQEIQVPGNSEPTAIYGGRRFVDYSQFKSRGHYTKTPALGAYFRTMMWLGRADTGWFVLPVDPYSGIEADSVRELRNASLLCLLLADSGKLEQLNAVSALIERIVGQSDNLTIKSLGAQLKTHGIVASSDLASETRVKKLADQIQGGGLAQQMIRSQAITSPDSVPYTIPPPALFQMFGQRFAIDSFVLSNVVFDSIIVNEQKIRRYMPTALDIMAALGNGEALSLLEPELRKWQYSGNLKAASEFVELYRPEFWQSSGYHTWLDALRELDSDVTVEKNAPESLRTRTWQYKQLQTQLASWSELRHDTILYAKQSFTAVPGCQFPDAYVEPYPEFFRKLRGFAEILRDSMAEAFRVGHSPTKPDEGRQQIEARLHDQQLVFLGKTIEILEKLELIATKELAGKSLNADEENFLKQTIDQRGSMPFGSGSQPRYDGWFCDMFYRRPDVLKWQPTIADVHTFPNPMGESLALEVGVGDALFCVLAVDCGKESKAYVGPVYSYYEFHQAANQRLTDEQWQRKLASDNVPKRPDWTKTFQAAPQKRTVDKIAVVFENQKFCVLTSQQRPGPDTLTFEVSDDGLAKLVQFLLAQDYRDQISLDLTGVGMSDQSLPELAKLPNLAFVSLPTYRLSAKAIEAFRAARPDVAIRPETFALKQVALCASVDGFRVYRPVEKKQFQPGDEFLVYVEVEGAQSSSDMGNFETILGLGCRIIDSVGSTLLETSFPDQVRRDTELPLHAYLSGKVQLPKHLGRGEYQLEISVSNKVPTPRNLRRSPELAASNKVDAAKSAKTTIQLKVGAP